MEPADHYGQSRDKHDQIVDRQELALGDHHHLAGHLHGDLLTDPAQHGGHDHAEQNEVPVLAPARPAGKDGIIAEHMLYGIHHFHFRSLLFIKLF